MSKILFLLLFVSSESVDAQSFDENDLIGTWITTEKVDLLYVS